MADSDGKVLHRYEVVRRWIVEATDPADATEVAKPGEHIDVRIHRLEENEWPERNLSIW